MIRDFNFILPFRMVELSGGSILIDDVDIRSVPLSRLRQAVALIPQDPVLLSGTVREEGGRAGGDKREFSSTENILFV